MDIKLNREGHEIFIPDGQTLPSAIERTTHLGVAAHPDDLEIMAYHGILKCFGSETEWFFGIVATDGAGSPRDGFYNGVADADHGIHHWARNGIAGRGVLCDVASRRLLQEVYRRGDEGGAEEGAEKGGHCR